MTHNEQCDHNALTFIAKTWNIKCHKCGKSWNIAEIKNALVLLEAEPRLQTVGESIQTIKEIVVRIDERIHRYMT